MIVGLDGCVKLIIKKSKYFLAVALIISGSFLNDLKVYADEPLPVCSTGQVLGVGNETTFRVVLNCTNVSYFVGSGEATANSQDLVGIKLHPGQDNEANPVDNRAVIGSDSLALDFYTYVGSIDRNLVIEAGVIANSEGLYNDRIEIGSDLIYDYARPYAESDYYLGSSYADLVVPYDEGLLINDIDTGGTVTSLILVDNPLAGDLLLNPDGSFRYSPFVGFSGSDSFTYIAVDDSGNQSDPATVLITDDAPQITGNFYRVGDGDNKHAKPGDEIRVDFVSNEPITIDEVRIGGVIIDASRINVIDETHFSAGLIMQDDYVEGMKYYSATVHDEFGNYASISTETDGVLFDKTPPGIDLNDSSEVELTVGDLFVAQATASDNFDEFVEVVVEGVVDSSVGGVYELIYSATDLAGNQSDKIYQYVTIIDNIAPDVTIDVTEVNGGWLVINGTINDSRSDLVVSIEGIDYEITDVDGEKWQFLLDIAGFKPGKYKFFVTATDYFGNYDQEYATFKIKPKNIKPADRGDVAIAYYPAISAGNDIEVIDDADDGKVLGSFDERNDTESNSGLSPDTTIGDESWIFWGISWYWWLMIPIIGWIGWRLLFGRID